MFSDNTYIADLTTGELKQLIYATVAAALQQQQPQWVTGMDGLCEIFGCSMSTAKRIKASGAIKDAIKQQGRTFVVNAPLALQLYGNFLKR